ncbi:MAG: DUF2095 family protein [Candidatus Hodarchaeota archaeon]
MEKDIKNDNSKKKIKVEDKEGLTLTYCKEDFLKKFPHLIREVAENIKSIKINSINSQIECNFEEEQPKSKNFYPNELYNPGAIDFIRRCSKIEEVIEILDYLMNRDEITEEDYNKYKDIISQEGGLDRLINESGGPKHPGYYLKKYYKKDIKNEKINSKED